MVYGDKSTQ
jgi:hypothetical protein